MYNGIIVVDKPQGISSHTVINKLRRIFDQKKIGHGGTLDPMATGVLPIFAGSATHVTEFVQNSDKEYLVTMKLGIVTDTQDITGTVQETREVNCGEAEVLEKIKSFIGVQKQLPPMYSAVQKDGMRLYKLAREGIEVERDEREITIFDIKLTDSDPANNEYTLDVKCSKGTYIRTLCADIGEALGCGATITMLRRIKTGEFSIENAYTLEQLAEHVANGTLEGLLSSADMFFMDIPAITLNDKGEHRLKNGAPVYLTKFAPGKYRVYGKNVGFMGLGEIRETDRRPELWLTNGLWL